MKAVFLYEIKRLFASVRTYVYLVLAIAAECAVFSYYNFTAGYLRPDTAISLLGTVLLALLPLVTAESFSGDGSMQRTFRSLGIPRVKCYFGRVLAVTASAVAPILLTFAVPPMMSMMGNVNMLHAYLSLFGLAVCTIAITAVLTAISAFCESVFNSYIASYAASAVLFTIPYLIKLLGGGTVITHLLGLLAPNHALSLFNEESFSIGALIALLLTTALAYAVGYLLCDKAEIRDGLLFRGLPVKIAAVSAALTLTVSLILGIIPIKTDITENGITHLSDKAVSEIKKIDTSVTVYLITPDDDPNTRMISILENICAMNGKITFETLDPAENTDMITQYFSSIDEASFGAVIVQSAKRTLCIPYNEFYYFSYETYEKLLYDYINDPESLMKLSTEQYIDGYRYEEGLIEAIAYCDSDNVKNAYVIGSKSISTALTRMAMKNMMSLTPLSLSTKDIPDDCDTVILNTAKDISETERKKLSDYLENGGKMLIMTDFINTAYTELNALCEQFGLSVSATDIILEDKEGNYLDENSLVIYTDILDPELYLAVGDRLIFTIPTVINVADALPSGVTVDTIIASSESSYVKDFSKLASEDDLDFNPEKDTRASYPVCVKATNESGAELILMTSSNIAEVDYNIASNLPAKAALTAILTKLADSSETTPTIPPKAVVNVYAKALGAANWICIGTFGAIALVLVIAGFKRTTKE